MAKKKEKPTIPAIPEIIEPTAMDELMGERFDIYAKDVIQNRAIPDARDGMKPVQRRIVYAMYETGNTINKPTRKCAKIVGEVMGKYHPHGDASIYEALVRLSQTWNMRLPLVDFQGNNGSMDGDGPAAFRYTEARLAAVSQELVRDIEKESVDMTLTFDDAELEPIVLPSRFPNLFVNGSTGIAVGMATEIPPHNLKEIVNAIIYRIQHPSCPIETLMRFVPGPDFPTGGIVYQSQGLADMYLTGRGRVDVASKTEIVTDENGMQQIIVTEIPYGVNKSVLVGSIDKLRHDKTLPGIEEVRDETDKTGLRIAIDIKTGYKPEPILAYLNSKTALKTSYSANMVAIVDGRPQTLNLLTYCDTYIAHQVDVITRRSKYDLAKDLARLSIVEGLIKASSIIDEIIRIIRASKDKADSKANLIARFGFTPDQAEAILLMPLYKLSHFDVAVVEEEQRSLTKEIADLRKILNSEEALDSLLIADLRQIAKVYGDERRTLIQEEDRSAKAFDARELVAKETVMVSVSRDGYVKRSSLASWKGSGGQNGALPGLKAGDTLIYYGQADTVDHMLLFTSRGNYLYFPVHVLKANKWLEEGMHVNYAISLTPDDKIVRAYAVHDFREDLNIVLLSRKGQIKRMKLSDFPVARFNRPIRAMKLLTDDEVVGAELTTGNSDVIVFSRNGFATRYNENAIALSSNNASGIKSGNFHGAPMAGLVSFAPEEKGKVLLITDLGHLRVFSSTNIEEGDRMGRTTVIFRTFKSEPHELVFVGKALDKEPPLSFTVTLNSGANKGVTFGDFNLTPMERYAKKDDKWPRKDVIATVFRLDNDYIDSSIVSFPPPVNPDPIDPIPETEDKPKVEILQRENDQPAERFEQISIFSFDDFDD
ncbi:MAG: DNA topoisomerase IV subunit A [Bacilli bacterium]|nr:DNA topoisomerase IV subunit A [Bacilli bacterium]